MSLWAITRSPLMFGGDLPTSDEAAIELITNDEVLAVDQHGANTRELFRRGNQIAWASDAPEGGGKYLAVFNVGDAEDEEIRVELKELGLSGKSRVRDLWKREDMGTFAAGLVFRIPAHGAGLYRVTPSE